MNTILEKDKYNYDIIINSEKILTIYNIHKYDKTYTEEDNNSMYELKVDIFNELIKEQLFLDIIDSLIKIYKNNFDFIIIDNFKTYIVPLNEYNKKIQKDYLLQKLHFDVIMKFDEVKITNSKKHEADLKDFFVKFTIIFNYNNNKFLCKLNNSSLYGMRSTRYDFELLTGYVHSHLSRDYGFSSFTNFCLGNGPISLVLIDLSNKVTPFNIIKFKGLLYQIKSYLSWESLEGGPYIKIMDRSNVHSNYVSRTSNCFVKIPYSYYNYAHEYVNQIKILINTFIKLLINNELINITLKKNLKKDINDIEIEISLEKELEFVNILKNNELLLTQLQPQIVSKLRELDLFAVKRNNEYYKTDTINTLEIDNSKNNQYLFEFKGESIKSKILSSESKNLESIEVLNPYFKRKLLSIIKNIILKNERRERNNEKSENYRVKTYENTSIYI